MYINFIPAISPINHAYISDLKHNIYIYHRQNKQKLWNKFCLNDFLLTTKFSTEIRFFNLDRELTCNMVFFKRILKFFFFFLNDKYH